MKNYRLLLALWVIILVGACSSPPPPPIPPPPPPTSNAIITTTIVKPAVEGKTYSFQFAAINCLTTCAWTITGLPSGLIATSTGLITGIPAVSGNFPLQVNVQ